MNHTAIASIMTEEALLSQRSTISALSSLQNRSFDSEPSLLTATMKGRLTNRGKNPRTLSRRLYNTMKIYECGEKSKSLQPTLRQPSGERVLLRASNVILRKTADEIIFTPERTAQAITFDKVLRFLRDKHANDTVFFERKCAAIRKLLQARQQGFVCLTNA